MYIKTLCVCVNTPSADSILCAGPEDRMGQGPRKGIGTYFQCHLCY